MKRLFFTLIAMAGLMSATNGQGTSCATSELLCDPNTTFNLGTSGSSAVATDCFGTGQPAPAFYTFAIAESGDINILIDTEPCLDVDYGLWGPFSTPDGNCGALDGKRVDCSFDSGCDNESFSIPTGIAGEFYILMITNFSGSAVTVNLSQTSGTGSLGGPLAFSANGVGPFFTGDAAVILGTDPPSTNPNVSITSITGPGVTNTSTGEFDPTVAGAGTHTITLMGTSYSCPVSTTIDIEVREAPVATNNDADGDGSPDIADPCSCTDPMNPDPEVVMGPGGGEIFHEVVTVTSATGETWNMTAATTGALDATGTPLALPAAMAESSPGVYTLDFYHEIAVGYTGEFSNGTSTLNVSNTCSTTCISTVPTLGEWGLVIFALLLLNMVVLFALRRRKHVQPSLVFLNS